MTKFFPKTSVVLLTSLLVLLLGAMAVAQTKLEKLPYSGAVLTKRAIDAGRITFPSRGYVNQGPANLTCSPAPCLLPNVDAAEGGTNPVNEDPIATDPNNSLRFITAGNDYNCGSLQGFFATTDGGTTFHRNCLGVLAGKSGAGDPAVAYDLNGTIYVTGIDLAGSVGQIVLASSTDGGVTLSAPHSAVKTTFSNGLTDKEWMEVDTTPSSPFKNTIYISLTDFNNLNNNSQITVSRSTDGGATFKTVKVGAQGVFPVVHQFSDLAIGKDGAVYVSYIECTGNGPTSDCGGTVASILVSKSTDGGATWSTPVVATTVNMADDTCGAFYGCLPNTSERLSNIPVIAIDNSTGPRAGTLYMAFYNNLSSQLSVRIISSTDGGATWSAQRRVSPASVTHDQFFPWINISASGLVGVTMLDRRDDPGNVNYNAYFALSQDGTTFVNRKLSTATSIPTNDGFGGTFMGDYTGNAWSGKTLYQSWMDTRSGVSQDEVGGIIAPR